MLLRVEIMPFLWVKTLKPMLRENLHHVFLERQNGLVKVLQLLGFLTGAFHFRKSNFHRIKHLDQVLHQRLQTIFL